MNTLKPPESRRTIVVLARGERRSILRDPDRVDLIEDPETEFLSFSDEPGEDSASVELLRSQNLLRPGTVAIQSPYDTDRYVAAEQAVTEFTVEKFFILVRLAMHLGAKRVNFEDVRTDRDKAADNVRLEAKHPVVAVHSSASRSIESDIRDQLKGEHVFAGGAPDVDAARGLLSSTRLTGDPRLVALVELRGGENPVTRQELKLSGTRECSGNLDVALRIAGGPGKLKLGGISSDLANEWRSKIHVEVITVIEF